MKLAHGFRALLLIVLMAPTAMGAVLMADDFEDDTVGQHPDGLGYTFLRTNGSNPSFWLSTVQATGNPGNSFETSQSTSANTGGNHADFILETPTQVTSISWDQRCILNSGSNGQVGTQSIIGAGGTLFSANLVSPSGNTCRFSLTCPSLLLAEPASGFHTHLITIDWNTSTFTWFVDDVEKGTGSFCSPGLTSISTFRVSGNGNGFGRTDRFDHLIMRDALPDIEPPQGSSEFDSGLIAFAASAGFISPESQFLFAMILIGLATVTTSASSKWVSPGRFKNYLLMGVQALVAVFCVIAAFLELWMFLVAFLLGLFAVRGGSEVRNTFFQIRDAIQAQNDREGEDIGPMGVMEVEVSQERQDAIERAVQAAEDARAVDEAPSVEDEPVPDSDEQEPTE